MRWPLFGCTMSWGLGLSVVCAQTTPPGARALQASNLLNPNISAVGWFQAEAGHRRPVEGQRPPATMQIKEVEVAVQSVVDPYARADVFVAVEDGGRIAVEEGTLTWFSLPGQLGLKLGKFHANFGRFNRIHRPETAFADRPLVHQRFLGEESLSNPGLSLSWHVPNPWLFMNLDAEATTAPEGSETPAFDKARRKDLLYVGRLNVYRDLTESTNVTLGGSFAQGPAGQEFLTVENSSRTLNTQLAGVDLTIRWKNPRRPTYRSLVWTTEVLWNRRDLSTTVTVSSVGLFSHLEWQFARRWRIGGRYDLTEFPRDGDRRDRGGLTYLTFTPSEYSLISLQGRRTKYSDGSRETLGFLKVTFNVGPHGTHPF